MVKCKKKKILEVMMMIRQVTEVMASIKRKKIYGLII